MTEEIKIKLTPKQEKFCQGIVLGQSHSEAYRNAYNSVNMKSETINRKAADVIKNGKVSARIAQLQQPVIKNIQITLEDHLKKLEALRNLAVKDKKYSAAINAEIARGKASGLYIEKLQHTGADGAPLIPPSKLSDLFE